MKLSFDWETERSDLSFQNKFSVTEQLKKMSTYLQIVLYYINLF